MGHFLQRSTDYLSAYLCFCSGLQNSLNICTKYVSTVAKTDLYSFLCNLLILIEPLSQQYQVQRPAGEKKQGFVQLRAHLEVL